MKAAKVYKPRSLEEAMDMEDEVMDLAMDLEEDEESIEDCQTK